MKWFFASVTFALTAIPAQAAENKPLLMIVGTPHFANPAHDIANSRVENVLEPRRQREIDELVERLARFRPNHVAVEWEVGDQAKLDRRYSDYRAGRLKLSNDETDQIGLRLAAKLGLPRVDAVDWLREPPGKDGDYDFVAWLMAHGHGARWDAYRNGMQREADAQGTFQRCHPIADWIRMLNDESGSRKLARPYFEIATFGLGGDNPGAAWVGAWYARNLRIFANLLQIGGAPEDRTIAVFGAGHGPLLRSDAAQSGRFKVVDVTRLLPSPSKADCPD